MIEHGVPMTQETKPLPSNRKFAMSRYDWKEVIAPKKRPFTPSDYRAQQNRIKRFRAGK